MIEINYCLLKSVVGYYFIHRLNEDFYFIGSDFNIVTQIAASRSNEMQSKVSPWRAIVITIIIIIQDECIVMYFGY